MTRLLVVDDHAAVREPLALLLKASAADLIVDEAGSVAEALPRLAEAELAIIDLALPDGNGAELVARLKRQQPAPRVLVLTSNVQTQEADQALAAGADAILHKSSPFATVLASVQSLLGTSMRAATSRPEMPVVPPPERADAPTAPLLTPRELDVLRFVADGLTDKEVAVVLGISYETVRTHLVSVFHKLGVVNRLQALRAAIRLQIIDPFE